MGEEKKPEEKLKEVGSKLETLPSTKDGVVKLLKVSPIFEF
jgi:sister-chromatid-cohesion protein PDS5